VEDERLASTLTELAIAQREGGKYKDSDATFTEALGALQGTHESSSETHAQLLVDLGRLELYRGHTKEAEKYLTTALHLMRHLKGESDSEVGAILAELAIVYVWTNELEKAEETARSAVQIYARVPDTHPDSIMANLRFAQILLYRDQLNAAAPIFEKALTAQRLVYGSSNGAIADTLGNMAQLRLAQGDDAKAEQLLREALAIYAEARTTANPRVGYLQTMLGAVLLERRAFSEAEDVLRETLEMYAQVLPPDHQYVASAEYALGEALLAQQKFGDSEAVLRASMNRWKRSDAPPWRAARSKSALGEVLLRQGRTKEGEQYLIESFRAITRDKTADKDASARAIARLERFYVDRGQRAKFDLLMQEQSARVAGNR
jgi:eukaryotic-like serine/threonine-protein kinase